MARASDLCRYKRELKKLFKQNYIKAIIGTESTRFSMRDALVLPFNIYGWLNII